MADHTMLVNSIDLDLIRNHDGLKISSRKSLPTVTEETTCSKKTYRLVLTGAILDFAV